MALSDWMAAYRNRRLAELHLPGSHDAGITKNYIDKTLFGTDSNSATQNLTITQQLMAGTRFFDLRLALHDNKVVAQHTTGGQGAYSKLSVNRVLQSAALWCSVHKTEVVIFRISHSSITTNAHEIAKRSAAGVLHTGTGNLCTKTLGDILSEGGGLVLIFDEEKFSSVINQREGIHGYTKYKTNPANQRGISSCGCYSMTHKLHKVVTNGLRGQYEHNALHGDTLREHLWQVYWQKTYVNPASATGIEAGTHRSAVLRVEQGKVHGGTHSATDYMIRLMKGHGALRGEDFKVQKEASHREGFLRRKVVDQPEVMFSTLPIRNYMLPNIFSYDFVNEEINRKVIELNHKTVQRVDDA